MNQLTQNGVQQIKQENNNQSIILQMIQPKDNTKNGQKAYQAKLSDGFCLDKVYFYLQAAEKLQEGIEKMISGNNNTSCFPIIKVISTIVQKEKTIISDAEWVLKDHSEIVGQPIKYSEYVSNGFTNPNGQRNFNNPNAAAGQQQQQQQPQQQVQQQNNNPVNFNNNNNNNNRAPQQQQKQQNSNQKVNFAGGNQLQFGNQRKAVQSLPVVQQPVSSDDYCLLENLNPSMGSNWKIKARIVKKNTKKEGTSKNNKPYKLFSINIMDSQDTEITCTFFGDEVDKFYDVVQLGEVYEFQNGDIKKNTNPQYNKGEHNITFGNKTIIQPVQDDNQIKTGCYKIKKLRDIQNMNDKETLDVCVVVHKAGDKYNYQTRNGNNMDRRDLEILDDTEVQKITIWREKASSDDFNEGNILILKDAQVNEYNGYKSLNIGFGTQIFVNKGEVPEVQQLSQYYNNQNKDSIQVSTAKSGGKYNLLTIEQIQQEFQQKIEQDSNKTYYFDTLCTMNVIFTNKNTYYYISCPECKKKVEITDDLNRAGNCEKCNKQVTTKARYIIQGLKISDDTGHIFAKCFDEPANSIIGKTADELVQFEEQNPEGDKKLFFQECFNKQFYMTLKVKQETYEGNTRDNFEIFKAKPSEMDSEFNEKVCRDMLQQIGLYDQELENMQQ